MSNQTNLITGEMEGVNYTFHPDKGVVVVPQGTSPELANRMFSEACGKDLARTKQAVNRII